MDKALEQFLNVDPQICQGKPCFRGTRIPVYVVLELLEGNVKPEQIVSEDYYPELTLDHIRAALHFATQAAKNQHYFLFPRPKNS